jgi:hypothetical protein
MAGASTGRKWLIGTVAVLLVSGCTEDQRSPTSTADVSPHATSIFTQGRFGSADLDGQELARALATTLNDPAVRVSLRNAMRFSPYNEHKLVLHEFVATGPGRVFLQTAARRSGVSEARLRELIQQLPPLDFYAPVPEHRVSWRGSFDVVLGLNLDTKDPTLNAYGAGGEQVFLDSRDGVPARTVLILHPVEIKGRRPDADRTRPGETISDTGTEATLLSLGGDDCEGNGGTQIAPVVCDSNPGSGVNPPHSLHKFYLHVGDGWGHSEIRVRIMNSGTVLHSKRYGSVPKGQWHVVNWYFNGLGTHASIHEMDSWATGADDFYGHSYSSLGNWHLGTPGYGPSDGGTQFYVDCRSWYGPFASVFYCDQITSTLPIHTVSAIFRY